MEWLLILSVLTVFGIVTSFETTQTIWNTVNDTTRLLSHTSPYVSSISPIECVLTALTYNRSRATYDGLAQRCFLHDSINQTEMTSEIDVLYVYVARQADVTLPDNDTLQNQDRPDNGTLQNQDRPDNGTLESQNKTVESSDIKTCGDLDPASLSGVYRMTPVPGTSFDVYCDMDSEGGPWTVIQNRQSNEVDFYRNWDQYKTGFGDLLGNFWLGNDHIFALTRTPCVMRIQLESLNGTFGYAEYPEFHIANEDENYKLSVDGFSGNISNQRKVNNGYMFTTPDRDNDVQDRHNCAETRRGPWWHKTCTHANLNGMYEYDDPSDDLSSMYWWSFFGQRMHVPMKTSRMLLKRAVTIA